MNPSQSVASSGYAAFPLVAGMFGGWEILLAATVLLILYAARFLAGSHNSFERGLEELAQAFRNAAAAWAKSRERTARDPSAAFSSRLDELILWLAQGFDVGRIPV